ncbi:MAG: sugar kinase [Deltaproteobacteria bacterium]|nr:sugar kinase [Deltaproteobacteria bacterium]
MSSDRQSFQVYGLGQSALDYIGKIDSYPPPDVKCEFSNMVIQGSCAFAGVLGDDPFGDMIRASLEEEGIDTSGARVRKGYESQFAFIAAEPGSGRRTIFWQRPTGPPLNPDEIDLSIIRQAKVVLTDGLFPEAALAACKAAKAAGVEVVVDAGSLKEGMLELARVSDYYLASEAFAEALVGSDKAIEACHKLAEFGPRVAAVTLGAKGYVALTDGRIIERPAYQVEAVDTTGCGDIFHAGFTYGIVQGWDVEKSLDLGAWSAAMVSRKLGGRAGIPTLGELAEKGYIE